MRKYPNLLKPIKLGNTVLKNRIIAAPTSMMDMTPDGRLTPYNISYFEMKARGGAAMVTLGESITDSETGKSHDRQIRLDDPNILPSLTRAVMAIKRHGALANIELSHGGKYGGITSIGGEEVSKKKAYGPSHEVMPNGEIVHEMDTAMIHHIVKSYGLAARKCKRAGFDMVMVHAAHGWLFNQFLSQVENKRQDEFGGSLENRARFLMMALDEVRKAVGQGFPIELRMNGDDFIEGAMHLDDYKELAKLLEDKVDLINVSAGSHDAENLFVRTHPSMFLEHGCNVYLAAAIKEVVSVPVACVGSIHTPEFAEEILASGKADIVELGRALLADPYFPKKAMEGRAEDITPCIRCFNCFASLTQRNVVACAVNPVIGQELDNKYFDPVSDRKKKVLVVGGGPGGMEAAITASDLGHEVILCDNSDQLGGALKFAGKVPFKQDLFDFAKVLEARVKRSKIDLRLKTEVTRELAGSIDPDVLILAAGGQAFIPPIKGIEGAHVMKALDAESDPSQIGDKVLILGGGLVGCETGVHLGMNGKEVTIVEMRDQMAPEANDFHKMALMMEMEKYVKTMTETKAVEIVSDGVVCQTRDGSMVKVEAETVILALGVRSNTVLTEELSDVGSEFYIIGDNVKPGQVMEAVWDGYYVARDL